MGSGTKKTRIKTEPAAPLALSLGALLGVEERLRDPSEDANEEKKPAPRRELPCRVILSRETKGRGGKTVTRLSFREGAPDAEALAKRLRNALGCGGTVEGDDVLLQGDQAERAAEWFAARNVRVATSGR